MVDKVLVKDYIAEKIGEEYVIPTLAIWDSAEEIDFSGLPDKFVLKCNHDSQSVMIVRDKNVINLDEVKSYYGKRLKKNGFWYGREWPYKNVKPRILAEKFMSDGSGESLLDYKFFCFNGVAKCYKIDFDRFVEHHANYYTIDGKLTGIGEVSCPPKAQRQLQQSANTSLMAELAEKLAADIPFLRCDFYDIDGAVYFGELTFFPTSGFGKFLDDSTDEMLGQWLKLPMNSLGEK